MDSNFSGPLQRYLPPLAGDSAQAFLRANLPPAAWILDPFAASPLMPVHQARAGLRVLTAAGNPILRFLLDLHARPPLESDLRAALAELAMARKEGERLENHINQAYFTRCASCKREIPAEAFVWDAKNGTMLGRIYTCPHCGDLGERPATEEDLARAAHWANADALHRARALERLAERDDPDRAHAEEALQMYLPRAIYSLGTIINRLDSIASTSERRRSLTALLLYALDQVNNLWPHPGERSRPRQLACPAVFREHNTWLALEQGLKYWSALAGQPPVHVSLWPEEPDETGGLAIFEGHLRALAEDLQGVPIKLVGGVFPRPNQAFWTLSALWSGWLWGREAVAPFKAVLRRRRYDWQWQAEALRSLFGNLRGVLAQDVSFRALIPELEPDFLSAVFLAASASGWQVNTLEVGKNNDLAWITLARVNRPARPSPSSVTPSVNLARKAARDFLQKRASPSDYLPLHAAILMLLAEKQALPWDDEALAGLKKLIREALAASEFIDLEGRAHPETGRWALSRWQGMLNV